MCLQVRLWGKIPSIFLMPRKKRATAYTQDRERFLFLICRRNHSPAMGLSAQKWDRDGGTSRGSTWTQGWWDVWWHWGLRRGPGAPAQPMGTAELLASGMKIVGSEGILLDISASARDNPCRTC